MGRVWVLCLSILALIPGTVSQWSDDLSSQMARGISEDTPIGQVIGRLRFQGNGVIYSTNSPLFTVNPTNGEVSLKEQLVYRNHHNQRITFVARVGENGNPITREVQLTVLPINHPPTFDIPSYRFSVKDNAAVGSQVYDSINIIDFDQGDNGTVTVSCDSQACSYFDVSTSEVQGFPERTKVSLVVKSPLSLDINPTLLRLRATDNGNPALSSTADVDFVVENSRDSRPVFTRGPYVAQVLENDFDPNRDILSIEVTDARAPNPLNGIRLQIEEDVKDAFMVGPTSRPADGSYRFPIRQKKSLSLSDNNFNPVYTFAVKAIQTSNGQDLPVVSESLVTMNIRDVNDQAPVFTPDTYSSSIPEGLANDATIPGVSILVSDADIGDNSKYQLSLEPNDIFDVTPKNGQGTTAVSLIVKQPSLVRYNPDPNSNIFRLVVKATETDTVEKRSATATVTLQVSPPTNNRPPSFPNRVNPILISDKTPVNSIISTSIKAEDLDTGVNGKLTYSIEDKDESRKYFNIDPDNGVLTLRSALDSTRNFEFDAIATDGGGLSAFTPINIVVFDTEGPIFSPLSYMANMTELGTDIVPELKVKAQLNSLVSDKVIQYRLLDNADFKANEYFAISQDGKITAKKGIDTDATPDKKGILEFNVEASVVNDQQIPANRAAVRIYINDINNNAPVFDPSNYRKVINESTPPNTPVLQVSTTDKDSGLNARVNYLILEQDSNAFEIETLSGVIKTAPGASLRVQEYKMKVLAIDQGSPPQSSTAQVEIDVTDVVKDPPIFENPTFEFFIVETADINALIGYATAQISEERAQARYTVVQDSWRGFLPNNAPANKAAVDTWFSLDERDAALKVKSKLSYELASRVTADIYVTIENMEVSNVPNRADASLIINILPVDSDRVVFSPSRNPYYFRVVERQPISTDIYTFVAFETKTSRQVTNFELTPVSPPSNLQDPLFLVGKASGILKVIKEVVFVDLPTNRYTYTLTAQGATASSTVDVIIEILPLSLNPMFNQQRYTFEVDATHEAFSPIGTVSARTPYNNGSSIVYSIVNPSNIFEIDNRGVIRLRRSFAEQQSLYSLVVRAQSGALYTDALVDVKVNRKKTQSPEFEKPEYDFVVPSGFLGLVDSVSASDPDPLNPYRVIYSIYNSTAANGHFTIGPTSGIINATQRVDKETNLTVVARADGYDGLVSNARVNIKPFAQSELPIFIEPKTTNIDVSRVQNGVDTFQVEGRSEVAGRSISYTIDPSSRDKDLFRIDGNSGVLSYIGGSVPDGFRSYELVLKISDGFTANYKKVNFNVFGQGTPSFKCFSNPYILMADALNQPMKPNITISSPSACSDNHPNTNYSFSITKINDIAYDDSPLKNFYEIRKANNNTLQVVLKQIPDGVQANRLQIAVGNSDSNLLQSTEDSRLNAIVNVKPVLFPGPKFGNLKCGGNVGKKVTKGILDLTSANNPVITMRAGDCHEDGDDPNVYSINKVVYKSPENLYYGEKESGPVDAFSIDSSSGLVLTKLTDYTGYYRGYFDVEVKVSSPNNKSDIADLEVYVLREGQKRVINFNKKADEVEASYINAVSTNFSNKGLTFVSDPVTTFIKEDGSRDTSKSSVCYFTVNDSRVVVIDEESFNATVNPRNSYANAAGPCYREIESTENWGGRLALWWVLIAFSILVFIIALLLACCVCCFWPINMRQMAKARPYFVVDDPPMYAGTMNTTDSVFEHK